MSSVEIVHPAVEPDAERAAFFQFPYGVVWALRQGERIEHVLCDIRPPGTRSDNDLGPEITLENTWQINYGRGLKRAGRKYMLDLEDIAKQHALSGGCIMSVIRFASLQALRRGSNLVLASDILAGIRREQSKEGTGG